MDGSILAHCRQCNQDDKPETDFYHFNTGKLMYPCKECVKANRKARYIPKRLPVPPPGQKRCPHCQQVFAATTDFFYSNRGKPDGLSTLCKVCHHEYEQARIQQISHTPLSETRVCTRCNEEKPATSVFFPIYHHIKAGLGPVCKACRNAEKRTYYHTHPEFREYIATYGKNLAPDLKRRRRETARKYRSAHRLHYLAYKRAYRKLPHVRAYRRVEGHRRRARLMQAPGSHTVQDIQKQYERQKGKCYWCGKKLGTGKRAYHVDHVVPLSRGGSNWPDNLVIACHTCNERKNDRLPHEWPEGGRLL